MSPIKTPMSVCVTRVGSGPACMNDLYTVEQECNGFLYHINEASCDNLFLYAYEEDVRGEKRTVTIKVENDRLDMTVIGDPVHYRQSFRLQEVTSCQYFLQGKTFVTGVYTKRLDYVLTKQQGYLYVEWELRCGNTVLDSVELVMLFGD